MKIRRCPKVDQIGPNPQKTLGRVHTRLLLLERPDGDHEQIVARVNATNIPFRDCATLTMNVQLQWFGRIGSQNYV
jgi:hypothetical protein